MILQKRAVKDIEYTRIFRSIIDHGQTDVALLFGSLQNFANQELQAQEDNKVSKMDVEPIYIKILYDSFKKNDDKERYLREQFDAENTELLEILAGHLGYLDMEALRSQVT